MTWVRMTDAFNSAEVWMRAQELAAVRQDDRLVTELKGAAAALYAYSAQNFTDYKAPFGVAVKEFGISQAERILVDLATIGVVVEDISTDMERAYMLLAKPDFIHIIEKDRKKMEAKRRADRNKGALVVPVLLRDGDECRYCSLEVSWTDRKGDEGGTFDHRAPDEPTSEDNYVVCCRGCNKLRHELGADADEELPLLPAPELPIYGSELRKKLAKWRRIVARECAKRGIADPLTSFGMMGEPGASSVDTAASGPTTNSPAPSTQSPAPDGRQSSREPRHPELESRQLTRKGRAANEAKDRTASAEVSPAPANIQSPDPRGSQPRCDSQSQHRESVRSPGSDKVTPAPARKRGRRKRRR